MLDELVGEANEAAAAFLKECRYIARDMIAIHCD
jgi:hypothetical protein